MERVMSHELPKLYRYQDMPISISPYFLYEVTIYKVSNMRSNMISNRYYISDVLLKVKYVEVIKRFKNFHLERFITLLSAPLSFIEENKLSIYETKQIKHKKHEKRTY